MAQHDMDIANADGATVRADLNSALQALVSTNAGATAPSSTFANMLWYDTASDQLMMRNEADDAWISLGDVNQTNDSFAAATSKLFGSSSYQTHALSLNELIISATDGRRALVVQAESGTADTLDKINVGNFNDGDMILITSDLGDTITVTHNVTGSGQVYLSDAQDAVLSTRYADVIALILVGTDWYEVARSASFGTAASRNVGTGADQIPAVNGSGDFDLSNITLKNVSLDGGVVMTDYREGYYDVGTVAANFNIDRVNGPLQHVDVNSGAFSLTLQNMATNGDAVTLAIKNGNNMTWADTIKWASSTAPSLASSGYDIITIVRLSAKYFATYSLNHPV